MTLNLKVFNTFIKFYCLIFENFYKLFMKCPYKCLPIPNPIKIFPYYSETKFKNNILHF